MVHSVSVLIYVLFVSLAPMAACLKPSIRSRARWWPSSRFLSSLICRRSSRRFPSCSSVTGKKKTTSCHLCFLTLFFSLGRFFDSSSCPSVHILQDCANWCFWHFLLALMSWSTTAAILRTQTCGLSWSTVELALYLTSSDCATRRCVFAYDFSWITCGSTFFVFKTESL